jgi:hypothetical protein
MHVVSGGDIIKEYSGTDRTFERAIQARGPTARVERLARVVTWHGMALVDGDGIFRIRFDHAHLSQFGRQPPKLGVARSRRSEASQAQGSEAAQRIAPGSPLLLLAYPSVRRRLVLPI